MASGPTHGRQGNVPLGRGNVRSQKLSDFGGLEGA